MPDTPVEPTASGPYDPTVEQRLSRLEQDVSEHRATLRHLERSVTRIETLLEATLPHLATKADLREVEARLDAKIAEKPTKTYMWGILAVLLAAYACGLAALAVVK